jgi:hypothetical protein
MAPAERLREKASILAARRAYPGYGKEVHDAASVHHRANPQA